MKTQEQPVLPEGRQIDSKFVENLMKNLVKGFVQPEVKEIPKPKVEKVVKPKVVKSTKKIKSPFKVTKKK